MTGAERLTLVTGAGGQLGRALAPLMSRAVLLTRRDLDVTDRRAVTATLDRYRPGLVVHAAAWTGVDAAVRDPEGARRVNVGGTQAVAAAAARVGALLVYPSTDYVFAGTRRRPLLEEDPTGPLSVYGQTKLEGEEAARGCERHLIVRTSWVFGQGGNFVLAILAAAGRRAKIDVVFDQVGLPTYAADLAEGVLGLVDRGATGTFHLAGGGDPCSWAELAEAALEAGHAAGVVAHRPIIRRVSSGEHAAAAPGPAAPRPRYSVLDCSKAAALGVRLRPWRAALNQYVATLGISPASLIEMTR